MDQYKHLIPSSETIDLNKDDWDDADDIELGANEHDLFLQQDYIKTSSKDVLPFAANNSSTSQQQQPNNVPNGHQQLPLSRSQSFESNNHKYLCNKIETFELIIGNNGSQSPGSSIVYQTPNYNQFAGNLAPSSPASIIVSMIIVIVILSVTILPIIFLPQSTTTTIIKTNQKTNDNVIKSNKNPIVHADVRCKCICPPFKSSDNSTQSNSTLTNNNGNNNNNDAKRRLYVGNTSPNQCNCNNIVLPQLTNNRIIFKDFCSSCECRYQSRNTATIKRNVVFFIIVLFGLGIYTLVQYLFKYFKITRRNLPRQFRWLSHQLAEND